MDSRPENSSQDGSVLSHLIELRQRLVKSLLGLMAGFAVAYYFSDQILAFLVGPLLRVLPAGQTLIYTGLPDAFIAGLKLGLWGGFLLSSPFWLYQLWAFIGPGLYGSERKQAAWLALSAAGLLVFGVAFGYLAIFPLAFKFFINFSGDTLTAMPALGPYLSLITTMLLGSGLVFQLPLVIIFMANLGLVSAQTLKDGRKYAVLIIFVIAAVLTPPDVISQCLLAGPMLILYEISRWLVARGERKLERLCSEESIRN